MKKLLSSLDLQDVQLVVGISMLGYGLFLVSPASSLIVLGSLFIAPTVLPSLFSLWRTR